MSLILQELSRAGLESRPEHFEERFDRYTVADVRREIKAQGARYSLRRAEILLSPAALECIEEMAIRARDITRQRFGNTIALYAPLYVSNHCVNKCLYCAFNCTHSIRRSRLEPEEAVREAELIAAEGFSDLLLVSGEDRKHVSVDYLSSLARRLRDRFSTISVEIQPLEREEYAALFAAGVDGVTLYQETYDSRLYPDFHPAGPKRDYAARLGTLEQAAAAGMRNLGLGALLGLGDWRYEALAVSLHAHVLIRNFWQSKVSISFPRIRPAEGVAPDWLHPVDDASLTQMICAYRLLFPDAGLVLSTRESAQLRDALLPLGLTRISAGSRTNPGGYGHGEETASGQFSVADTRSPAEVARMVVSQGFDPVWKDWDSSFIGNAG